MTDLDLPLLPSAEQIRRREFATIRRGYDPDQVRDYLHQVAAQVEKLEKDVRDAKLGRAKIEEAADTVGVKTDAAPAAQATEERRASPDDAYESLAKRFSSLIATADREASKILAEARAEAAEVLEEARSEADRIRVDAQARAEEARHQGSEALVRAREEADRLLSSLSQRRDSLVEQMQQMRTRLLAVAHELETEMSDSGADDDEEDDEEAERRPSSASHRSRKRDRSESPVDPRYEDLWVSGDDSVDIPDLASIDLDVDDETGTRD